MSRPYFQFQRFTVFHDRCAMKVGTDGVLLGAWADLTGAIAVLDIGTGTGLLALMAAQRCEAAVTGIDIDGDAVEQAWENAKQSPWADRLSFVQADALTFAPEHPFDAIVCNPPFFEHALLSPDKKRTQARHTSTLPLEKLALAGARLLRDEGRMNVVLPTEVAPDFVMSCWEAGLNLYRRCTVHSKMEKPPKRVLLSFKKGRADYPHDTCLCLMDVDGNRSASYTELTKEFYLEL